MDEVALSSEGGKPTFTVKCASGPKEERLSGLVCTGRSRRDLGESSHKDWFGGVSSELATCLHHAALAPSRRLELSGVVAEASDAVLLPRGNTDGLGVPAPPGGGSGDGGADGARGEKGLGSPAVVAGLVVPLPPFVVQAVLALHREQRGGGDDDAVVEGAAELVETKGVRPAVAGLDPAASG